MMRIDLAGLDASSLVVDLPPGGEDGKRLRAVNVDDVASLRGSVAQEGDMFRLSDVAAELLSLAAADLWFGTVHVAAPEGGRFRELELDMKSAAEVVSLKLNSAAFDTRSLQIALPNLAVQGATMLAPAQLGVEGDRGWVAGPEAIVEGFRLSLAGLEIVAERLQAEDLVVRWAPGAFELHAARVRASGLTVSASGTTMKVTAATMSALDIRDGDIEASDLSVRGASAQADFDGTAVSSSPDLVPAPGAHDAPEHADRRPLVDWDVLDQLSGTVAVDATVDIEVPVIGHRCATHQFRLQLVDGTVDFREIESGLARLEDSFLDFSVREDALVLEVGIPILPTRGHGKPIVAWALTEAERELADQGRVRLATLVAPFFEAKAPGAAPPSSKRRVMLRELALEPMDLSLSLTDREQPLDAAVSALAWDALRVSGTVRHRSTDVDEAGSPEGHVTAEADTFALGLSALPVGARYLDVRGLEVRHVRGDLTLDGARPRSASVEIDALESRALVLSSTALQR